MGICRDSNVSHRQTYQVAKRRPIPRKGHKKSRAGCLVCKRRKVKCDETTPACGPCVRLGLGCSYPEPVDWVGDTPPGGSLSADADADAGGATDKPLSNESVSIQKPLRNELLSFTMTDLGFFQHFLFAAYPSLPVGGWDVWQDVSRLAHQASAPFLSPCQIPVNFQVLTILSMTF